MSSIPEVSIPGISNSAVLAQKNDLLARSEHLVK
jgi:hypothetical protein